MAPETQPQQTETKSVASMLPETHKDRSTAGLTLPSVPQQRGFDSNGNAVDPALIARAREQREIDLGIKKADATEPVHAEETRQVAITVDEKSNTQSATTVVAEAQPAQADATEKSGGEEQSSDQQTLVTGESGRLCKQSGDYQCIEHTANKVRVLKGEKFPLCDTGNHATTWRFVAA